MLSPTLLSAQQWLDGRKQRGEIRPATYDNYWLALRKFAEVVGDKKPKNLNQRDAERYVASLSHLSPGTAILNLAAVRGWCDHLVVRGVLPRNPFVGVRGPRRPEPCSRAFTQTQVAALIGACQTSRERLIIELGVQLGLRASEIASLQVGDIDMIGRLLVVRHGKGGKRAVLGLTEAAETAIVRYLADYPIKAGPLFRSERRPWDGLTRQWVSGIFRRIAYEAKVKDHGWDGNSLHALRHTMATDVYERTKDLYMVKGALRHSRLSTVEHYARNPSLEAVRQGMEGRCYRSS